MTVQADHLAATLTADPHAETKVRVAREGVEPTAKTSSPDRSVYLDAVGALLPRWLDVVGAAPWLRGAKASARTARASALTIHRRQAATLAIGLLTSLDEQRADDPYLRACVRASLIEWQLTLGADGRPIPHKSARSALHPLICASVVHLLTETPDFQTVSLLQDIERHIRWLTRRRPATPYVEAAAICTIADGAVLCRDASLLGHAQDRLDALLKRQNAEGWFPERGGADIGRLSLTVDFLSRVYQQGRWEQLAEPLRRALSFLLHFVHPDGASGGCYGSCGTGFLSPYGVEVLAPTFPDAAKLALVCRRRFAQLAAQASCDWTDDLCCVLGVGAALAAANAPITLQATDVFPHAETGETHFPRAGLSIFSTKAYHAVVGGRKGGSLHVTWRNAETSKCQNAEKAKRPHTGFPLVPFGVSTLEPSDFSFPCLDDPGLSVVFQHKIRTSNRQDARTRYAPTPGSVGSSGILRPPVRERPRRTRWLLRAARRLITLLGFVPRYALPALNIARIAGRVESEGSPGLTRRLNPDRLAHDRFLRHITFGDDWVRIHDVIECTAYGGPCHTIVCQSDVHSAPGRTALLVDTVDLNRAPHAPIFIEGGRRVEITRLYKNGALVDPRTPRAQTHA